MKTGPPALVKQLPQSFPLRWAAFFANDRSQSLPGMQPGFSQQKTQKERLRARSARQ